MLYRDDPHWMHAHIERLIVELESLILGKRRTYYYVVIDEIETLLRILLSDTLKGKRMETIHKLMEVISRATRLIVMDSQLKTNTVIFMSKNLRCQSEYKLVINEFSMTEVNGVREVFIYDNQAEWHAKFLDDTRRKVLASEYKSVAEILASEMDATERDVKCITGDSTEEEKSADPNEKDGWINYDDVIYTPAITSSVSFIHPRYEVLYVYAQAGIGNPEDTFQSMHRVRQISSKEIHMYIGNFVPEAGKLHTSKSGVLRAMKTQSILFRGCKWTPELAQIWGCMESSIKDLMSRVMADHGLGQMCFREIMKYLLMEEAGYNVHENIHYQHKVPIPRHAVAMDVKSREIFDTYIDSEWDKADETFRNIWSRGNGVLHVRINIGMARGIETLGNKKYSIEKAVECMNDLSELCLIGGVNLQDKLERKEQIMNLAYTPKDRIRILNLTARILARFEQPKCKQPWSSIERIFDNCLYVACEHTQALNNSWHKFKVYIGKWMYHHAIIRSGDPNYKPDPKIIEILKG